MAQNKELPRGINNALMREASMSSMAIGIGLTHIRQYDFTCTGFFYSGLFSFTTGIERLLKIILIYDYRLNNGDAFPNNTYLKGLSHKLDDLIRKAREINKNQSMSVNDSFLDQDLLYQRLISLFADFAVQARYYNLDYLTGKQQTGTEPLERWEKEICTEIVKRHYKQDNRKLELKKHLAKKLENVSQVQYTHDDGSEINTMAALMTYEDIVPTKQKYSMYYLYTIVRFFINLLTELGYKGNFYPYLREFFAIFNNADKDYILRKKVWNPMSP
jgi:hypothetical protein